MGATRPNRKGRRQDRASDWDGIGGEQEGLTDLRCLIDEGEGYATKSVMLVEESEGVVCGDMTTMGGCNATDGESRRR